VKILVAEVHAIRFGRIMKPDQKPDHLMELLGKLAIALPASSADSIVSPRRLGTPTRTSNPMASLPVIFVSSRLFNAPCLRTHLCMLLGYMLTKSLLPLSDLTPVPV
jgi:hypothetical protein